MKTAISLADGLFRDAERFARRAKRSRSSLYAEAISEYLARHSPDEITESLDQVIAKVTGNDSTFLNRAARKAAAREKW